MSPLHVEVFHSIDKKWLRVGEVHSTDPAGSMSDNKPNGQRDLYRFECAKDDSKSTIYRCGISIDREIGVFREVLTDVSKMEVVKELKNEESFEINVKTDKSSESIKIRFTHRKLP